MPIRILKPDEPITKKVGGSDVTWEPLDISEKMQLGALIDVDHPLDSDAQPALEVMAEKLISI